MHCRPTGLIRVDFHDGETFSFNPIVTTIQHILVGQEYIDHFGTVHLKSSQSALSTKVKFKEPVLGRSQHKVALCLSVESSWTDLAVARGHLITGRECVQAEHGSC